MISNTASMGVFIFLLKEDSKPGYEDNPFWSMVKTFLDHAATRRVKLFPPAGLGQIPESDQRLSALFILNQTDLMSQRP